MRRTFEDENPGGIPWTPPTGFENPVPEPGEARARALGKAVPFLAILITLLIVGAVLYDQAGDVKRQIEDKWDEITEQIEQAGSQTESSTSSASSDPLNSDDGPRGDADGKTNLPGGYASATFTVDGYMAETANRQDTDGKYDGSTWQVTQVGKGGVSYATLRYAKYVPPIATAQQRKAYLDGLERYHESAANGNVKTSKLRIDGHSATEFSYKRKADGAKIRAISIIGDPSSYELNCVISKLVPQFSKTCDELVDSMKISGPG